MKSTITLTLIFKGKRYKNKCVSVIAREWLSLEAKFLEHVWQTARGLKPSNDHQIVDASIVIYNLNVGTVCRQYSVIILNI